MSAKRQGSASDCFWDQADEEAIKFRSRRLASKIGMPFEKLETSGRSDCTMQNLLQAGPMTHHAILVYARDARTLAIKIARRVGKLGFNVEPLAIDKFCGAAVDTEHVIVLWSCGAAAAEATFKHPDLAAKLCIGRLASGPPPPLLRAPVMSVTGARSNDKAWRAFFNAETMHMKQDTSEFIVPGNRSSRWEAALAALLMTIVVGGASYVASPDFAHRVDATVASFGG